MATYRRTFTSAGTLSGKAAFTNPNNARKADTTTSTYASGNVSNSSTPGNRFTFGSDAFSLPSGVSGTINKITIYTARYCANTSSAGFNVGGYFNNSTVSLIVNRTGGNANSYIQELIDVPSNYWNSTNIAVDVSFQRNGGNGIAVRVPYLFIEIDYTEQISVTGVTILPESVDLYIGRTQQFTAVVSPSNAVNKAVTWASSNNNIVNISNTGLATAVALGTATITATTVDGGYTDTSSLSVVQMPQPEPTQNVYVGNIPVSSMYVGASPIVAAYLGSTKIFPQETPMPSYFIDANNVRHDFELANTPIANFSNTATTGGSVTINGASVPVNNIKQIVFGRSYLSVTTIPDSFLRRFTNLIDINLYGLSNVTIIRTYLLSNCTSLTSLDLSPLSKVTSIGDSFIYNCISLTSLDLSPLSNVAFVSDYFLRDCTSLTSLDLSPLSKVASISDYFLRDCTSLTSLDLSPLSNITSIGTYFLNNCSGLTELHCGDFDASKPGISSTGFLNGLTNVSTSIRYHTTQQLADAMLAKAYTNSIQNWQVVITG